MKLRLDSVCHNSCTKTKKGSHVPKSGPQHKSKVRILIHLFFVFLTLRSWVNCSRAVSSLLTEIKKGPKIINPKDRWLAKGAGDAVDTVTMASLEPSDSETIILSSDQYNLICSYNWVNKTQPAVYVPGGAPIFEEISLPATVKPDSGRQFVDQNAARIPDYPFEVVFQAAEMMNPTVRFDDIDVLTNRNSLRKFFEFCKGRAQDSFRVNLYLVNNTLIIERCVRSTTEFLYGSGGSGFGHNFEKAATRLPPGLENSLGHHRVLQYDFGGLKCAVRFEVDASYKDPEIAGPTERQSPTVEALGEGIESLATGLSTMVMSDDGGGPTIGSANTIRCGKGTAQTSVAELKSIQITVQSQSRHGSRSSGLDGRDT
ncbi:hypothetical protein N8I77_013033 [Diaporthe amygdali]|uniref:Uncharacterized protein n=1 Tax=Phomopsis amygdali TaxID=1214568 RepID=A0AAD9VX98_PHOAM|nr:hypothetical protein N8I77_013033 [Diaporthe amygdali]